MSATKASRCCSVSVPIAVFASRWDCDHLEPGVPSVRAAQSDDAGVSRADGVHGVQHAERQMRPTGPCRPAW
jgi:hypothetical protein